MSYPSEKARENSVQSVKPGDNDVLNRELNEQELDSVQGGALTPEQVAEVGRLAKEAGEHHGINVSATIGAYTIGTIGDFGANALGQLAGSKVHKKH